MLSVINRSFNMKKGLVILVLAFVLSGCGAVAHGTNKVQEHTTDEAAEVYRGEEDRGPYNR